MNKFICEVSKQWWWCFHWEIFTRYSSRIYGEPAAISQAYKSRLLLVYKTFLRCVLNMRDNWLFSNNFNPYTPDKLYWNKVVYSSLPSDEKKLKSRLHSLKQTSHPVFINLVFNCYFRNWFEITETKNEAKNMLKTWRRCLLV